VPKYDVVHIHGQSMYCQ